MGPSSFPSGEIGGVHSAFENIFLGIALRVDVMDGFVLNPVPDEEFRDIETGCVGSKLIKIRGE